MQKSLQRKKMKSTIGVMRPNNLNKSEYIKWNCGVFLVGRIKTFKGLNEIFVQREKGYRTRCLI